MKKLAYQIRFVTPAFLGDANQNGQWRTPPFKALLRQWWRVAYAADYGFDVNVVRMRQEEGLLFGNAWLEGDFRKSFVRMRLDRWDEGGLTKTQWPTDAPVIHPEVTNRENTPAPVGSELYLGYGPLTYDKQRRATSLKANAAIQAGESARLSIACPSTHQDETLNKLLQANAQRIERALWLIDRYGSVGGRSRNGWGSFSLTPIEGTPSLMGDLPLRPWRDALGIDWPHAIGRDERDALAWGTNPCTDWKALMRVLAIIKIGLRTQFVFMTGPNAPHPENRHWLSHPVTKHNVAAWKERGRGEFRLPNSLRFKVRLDVNDPKKLVGVIFHVPCLPPPEFHPNQTEVVQTWQAVHALLDELTRPVDSRTYASITDVTRRTSLKTQLNTVNLTRITE